MPETEHVVDAGQYARFLAWQAKAEAAAAAMAQLEAAAAAMAQLVAADVHCVMMQDMGYAELVRRLAVATIAGLETETGRIRG